ncbi:MAG: hypothetical protein LBG46_06490, partial [Elusimicrobiota bacterium]|nr:hypothetical protein [Elusimicrobiota bacterium]
QAHFSFGSHIVIIHYCLLSLLSSKDCGNVKTADYLDTYNLLPDKEHKRGKARTYAVERTNRQLSKACHKNILLLKIRGLDIDFIGHI